MNNIWRIALGGIVSKPGRTSILALAVALGIALMISIRTAYMTVRDAQAPIHAGTEAGADWILEPSGGEPVPLTEETASAVQALPGVRSAILRESAFVKVNLDGTWQPGILFGTDPEREQQAGLLQLKAGMLPGNDVPGVAIRHQLARRLGLELGDKITVTRQGTSITLPVVGFLGPEGIGSASGSIGVTTTRSVMEKAGLSPSSGKILVKLENGINREQWLNEHQGFLRTAGLEPRVPVTYSHQSPVFTVLLIASFLGPAFSTILIQGSFAIVMRQREQEWQLWRIVGATRRQLRNLMLLEGVFIGVIGGLAGFAIGLVMARMIVRYLASLELLKYSPMEPVPLAIHPVTILFSLLFGVLVAVAASVRPILNEIRKPFGRTGVWPSSAPPSGGRFGLWLGGSACLAALSFLVGQPFNLLAGFAGVLCLLPALSGIVHALSRKIPQLGGSCGTVVSLGIQRIREHGAATEGSARVLLLAVALIVGFQAVHSASWANTRQAISAEKADVYISGHLDESILHRMAQIDGVEGIQAFFDVEFVIGNNAWSGKAFAPESGLPFILKEGDESRALSVMREGNAVLLGNVLANRLGLHPGDSIEITVGGRTAKFQVAGVVPQIWDDSPTAWFRVEDVEHGIPDKAASLAFVRLISGADAKAVEEVIEQLQSSFPEVKAESKANRLALNKKLNREKMMLPLTLLYLLLSFSVIGIMQGSWLQVIEQRRDLALLRSAGATVKQSAVFVLSQASFSAVVGSVIGGIGGSLIGVHLVSVIGSAYRADLTGGLPEGYIPVAAALAIAVLSAVPAVLWSVRRPVAATLREE